MSRRPGKYGNISRLREIFSQLSHEVRQDMREDLPPGVFRRVDGFIGRGRRLKNKLLVQKEKRKSTGGSYLRRKLIGAGKSVTEFIDGELIPPRMQPLPETRSRPRKVVRRKK